ncbi:MAG: stage II sporulation protein P [Clostridiales bacterium]|nr:stage II sporulation protein P [Clostridiales bacterium]
MRRNRTRKRRAKSHKLLLLVLLFWGVSALTSITMLNWGQGIDGQRLGEEVGKQYLSSVFPVISRNAGTDIREPKDSESEPYPQDDQELNMYENNELEPDDQENEGIIDSINDGKSKVLIYHTHATESYQPVSEGNFHSVEEQGTVREVGKVLKEALDAEGIGVIHDKTLHDVPSYSKSYSRSMETIKRILDQNPSIMIVIDLHRDAASYSGNKGHKFTVHGKTCAQFCLVVGMGNENVDKLMEFANKVNQKANSLYPGFSRGIIKKEYKYNQYIRDNYLLLEMGNNQNRIEEAKESAKYFAKVLAEIIKEMQ